MEDALIVANAILAHEGIVDAFGHVSVRHPDRRDRFWLACSRSPANVTADDLMQFDLDGVALHGDTRPAYVERFIHAAIYRARDDVAAVVHSHAPALLPFTISMSVPLVPVIHVAGMCGMHIPRWDIADRFGETDLLVRSIEQGADLAAALGSASCALMRGHGAVMLGTTLKHAVLRAIFLHMNAAAQQHAHQLGAFKGLSEEEAALSERAHEAEHVVDRAWSYFARRAGHGGES